MDYNHAVGKEKERQNKSSANLEKILYRSEKEWSSIPYRKVLIRKAPVWHRKSWKRLRSKSPERKEYILYMGYHIQKNEETFYIGME